MKKIAIFASGSGTNAEKIVKHFNNSRLAEVSIILSNNKNAYVLERAKRMKIRTEVFGKNELYNTNTVLDILLKNNIDIIVLAGFLLLIPVNIIKNFKNKIVNIHPALLPLYGGKGMFGDNVHEAVIRNNEKESGITIHYVNEKYDEGAIILQAKCKIEKNDTPQTLAAKIHKLEYEHYAITIESLIKSM